MNEQTDVGNVGEPEASKLAANDPFLDLVSEVNNEVARRAYLLFESRGSAHGNDQNDWLRAQSEILVNVPVDVIETETGLTIRADVPGLNQNNLEVRVVPRAICIIGTRQVASDQVGEKIVYSERRSNQFFRTLELPSEIDPEKTVATLGDGVLEIKLPKVGADKKIPVRVRAASA